MKIRWLGHACFLLESQDGTKIVTDPFDGSVGYKIPMLEADIVTVSHDHYDHNYVEGVQGDPQIIKSAGEFNIDNIRIKGVPAYHDEVKGAKRGPNIIYNFDIDGIKVCHVGDLGHLLSKTQLEEIGDVDCTADSGWRHIHLRCGGGRCSHRTVLSQNHNPHAL